MNLPDEMWTEIFGYLDKVTLHKVASLVNKHWLALIRNNQQFSGKIELSKNYLRKVFKLDVSNVSDISNGDISILDCKLHSGLSKMFENWPKLKVVSIIWNFHYYDSHLYTQGYTISCNARFDERQHILTQFKTLDDLKIKWNMPFLEEVSIVQTCVEDTSVSQGFRKRFSSRLLDFVIEIGRNTTYNRSSIYTNKLQYMANCDYIQVKKCAMFLTKCYILAELKWASEHVRNITDLSIIKYDNSTITDTGFQNMFITFLNSQNITSVEIYVNGEDTYRVNATLASNNLIKFLSQNCPNLKVINLRGDEEFYEDDVSASLPDILRINSLERLSFFQLNVDDNDGDIFQDKHFQDNLKELKFEKCAIWAENLLDISGKHFQLEKLYIEGKTKDPYYRFLNISCSQMEEILDKLSKQITIRDLQILNCVSYNDDFEKNFREKYVPIIQSKFSKHCYIKITYCDQLELEDLNPENDNTLFLLEKKANQPEAYVTVQSYPLEWFPS